MSRDSLWTYDKVDIEKKWDFSLRKEFFIENSLQRCNYNSIEQSTMEKNVKKEIFYGHMIKLTLKKNETFLWGKEFALLQMEW